MSVNYITTSEIDARHFLKLLILNIQNGSLTDDQFRGFVHNTLPMVQGYEDAKTELKRDGREIPGEPKTGRGIRSSAQFEEGAFESQTDWMGKR